MSKKYVKGILKPEQVEGFRLFLKESGVPVRDGKGEFQVLQVQACPPGWAVISRDKNGVLSIDPDLIGAINMFKNRKPAATPAQAPAPTDTFSEDLRDDFAIAALSMLSHRHGGNAHGTHWDAAAIANASYELADAMLVARKSTK